MQFQAASRNGLRRSKPLHVLLLSIWLTLSGCALPPQASAPRLSANVKLPPAWSIAYTYTAKPASSSLPSLVSWWQCFDDPLLTSLIAQAMQHNTSVNTAQATLRQARALRDLAVAGLAPTLGSSASASRGTAGGKSTGNSFQVGLDAKWTPDVFGAANSGVEASEATLQASNASLGDVQVAIATELGLNYITLRAAQARLAIATDNLASQQETWQITNWRLQAGLVTSLDAEQARAAIEQTRALLPTLQTSITQTGHALAVLTGQAPATLNTQLATARSVPQASESLTLRIPADTLRQRADVRAAEYQMRAAFARVSQADAARYPSFSFGGSLGLNGSSLSSLGKQSSVLGNVLAGISFPLLDGGTIRAQIRVQQAALEQSRVAYQAAVLTALQDVENALAALRDDRLRLVNLRNSADAAANAATMARQQYSSGLVDFQIVLETQRTQLSAQDNLASVNADISTDHVRLFKALGGGWRDDLKPSMPTQPQRITTTSPS